MNIPTHYWTSQDGRHVIYCADCLTVLPHINNLGRMAGAESPHEPNPGSAETPCRANLAIDAVITDPPYSSGTRREGAKGLRRSMNRTTGDEDWFGSDSLTTQGFCWMMRAVASQCKRAMVKGGHFLSFIDWRMSHNLAAAIESADMRYIGLIVWDKVAFGMGTYFRNQHELVLHFSHGKTRPAYRHDVANVLTYSRIMNGDHDTEKPVDLLVDLITTTASPDGIVCDPFMGSGTTGVACVRTGRRFIGIEIEPKYCAIAVNRMEKELAQPFLPALDPNKPKQEALL